MTAPWSGSFSKASRKWWIYPVGDLPISDSLEQEVDFLPVASTKSQPSISLTEQGKDGVIAIRAVPSGKCQSGKSDPDYYRSSNWKLIEKDCHLLYPICACSGYGNIVHPFFAGSAKVVLEPTQMVDQYPEPFWTFTGEEWRCDLLCQQTKLRNFNEWIPLYYELLYTLCHFAEGTSLKWLKRISLKEFEGQDFLVPYGRLILIFTLLWLEGGCKAERAGCVCRWWKLVIQHGGEKDLAFPWCQIYDPGGIPGWCCYVPVTLKTSRTGNGNEEETAADLSIVCRSWRMCSQYVKGMAGTGLTFYSQTPYPTMESVFSYFW